MARLNKRKKSLKKAREVKEICQTRREARKDGDHLHLKRTRVIEKLLQNIKAFFFGQPHSLHCTHLVIGASQIHHLIKGQLTPKRTHKREYFKGAKSLGNQAEIQFQQNEGPNTLPYSRGGIKSSTGKRSEDFPWLVATPDFIYEHPDGSVDVVEVKTFTTDAMKAENTRKKGPAQRQLAT